MLENLSFFCLNIGLFKEWGEGKCRQGVKSLIYVRIRGENMQGMSEIAGEVKQNYCSS